MAVLRRKTIIDLLKKGIPPQQWPLYKTLPQETAEAFLHSSPDTISQMQIDDPGLPVMLVKFLITRVNAELTAIDQTRRLASEFNKRLAKATTEKELHEYILALAEDLGASPRALAQDKKALQRWLDKDTVLERCARRVSTSEYAIVFYLTRIGIFAPEALARAESPADTRRIWRQLDLENVLETIFSHVGDERLRVALFSCLADALRVLPSSVRSQAVKDSTLNYIYRSSLEARQQVWIQAEALRLLAVLSPQALENALNIRLNSDEGPDDIFVRRRAVKLLGQYMEEQENLRPLLLILIHDPSPYVRQEAVKVLAKALEVMTPGQDQPALPERFERFLVAVLGRFESFLLADERHEVRAAGVLVLPQLMSHKTLKKIGVNLLCRILRSEKNSFVLRTSIKIIREIATLSLLTFQTSDGQMVMAELENLHTRCHDLSVRRWTAQAINAIAMSLDADLTKLYNKLEDVTDTMKLGKRRYLPKQWFTGLDDIQLGRVLTQLAEEKGTMSLEKGLFKVRLTKGDRFTFKAWRLFHELRHPSPDKRQAHSHTIGRVYSGNFIAPTPIMAEITQTKVPGEPLYQSTESGWRPYLPLVDHALFSLSGVFLKRTITIFTAEGITRVLPPRGLLRRIWARTVLTLRYSSFSRLRNWNEQNNDPPSSYIRQLEKLGLQIIYTAYGMEETDIEQRTDPTIRRFFPAIAIPAFDPVLVERFKEYIFSVYENSLYELAIFAIALSLVFFGQRLYASFRIRQARKGVPLVIGGWGTRGKSGVERLKAALFESLGHSMISKSTGCEAMFLHVDNFGKTQEMFLFRPYDKASIWEHHNLILMARAMDCSVFLWECMGLTPSYVEILQNNWSKDDFSTITNTYPDHEDIQGPAGYDIPKVMTCFIPSKGNIITTEEQMLPILAENAAQKKSTFSHIGWLEAGLLTPDILHRFPYEEHPYNIALVTALAEQMGIPKDMALKEMADRVIPDLGVLKSFPIASIAGRKLEFVNGMSANERFATLSNWQRMGFEAQAQEPEPGIWLHVLINNRADRVSRSQMFASILVNDLSADRYILIGSNLSGLKGYIQEAWEEHLTERMAIFQESQSTKKAIDFLETMAKRLRIAHNEKFLALRLRQILPEQVQEQTLRQFSISPSLQTMATFLARLEEKEEQNPSLAKEHLAHIKNHLQDFLELYGLRNKLQSADIIDPDLYKEIRTQVTSWFTSRLVTIQDFHATGDQVIRSICQETPPGLTARIMGMQNIKGTGLDFVYRWQAWERCWASCIKLRDENEQIFEEGLHEMMLFGDYGLLCQDFVEEGLVSVNRSSHAQTERVQAGLLLIKNNLEKKLHQVHEAMTTEPKSTRGLRLTLGTSLIHALEACLDAGDAIQRRKTANTIYKDLASERISHARAAQELQALNKRQKGGWLVKKLL